MSKSAKKILDTAESLFNEHSFTTVGVDLIRDISGCSKTTMYTHFKNKTQLIQDVLQSRDQRFRENLLCFIGNNHGQEAILKILDWHALWFQQEHFKGCLFVRAVAESERKECGTVYIAQDHKRWMKKLISKHCENQSNIQAELIYTLIEGLISRFMVEEFNLELIGEIRKIIFSILKNE